MPSTGNLNADGEPGNSGKSLLTNHSTRKVSAVNRGRLPALHHRLGIYVLMAGLLGIYSLGKRQRHPFCEIDKTFPFAFSVLRAAPYIGMSVMVYFNYLFLETGIPATMAQSCKRTAMYASRLGISLVVMAMSEGLYELDLVKNNDIRRPDDVSRMLLTDNRNSQLLGFIFSFASFLLLRSAFLLESKDYNCTTTSGIDTSTTTSGIDTSTTTSGIDTSAIFFGLVAVPFIAVLFAPPFRRSLLWVAVSHLAISLVPCLCAIVACTAAIQRLKSNASIESSRRTAAVGVAVITVGTVLRTLIFISRTPGGVFMKHFRLFRQQMIAERLYSVPCIGGASRILAQLASYASTARQHQLLSVLIFTGAFILTHSASVVITDDDRFFSTPPTATTTGIHTADTTTTAYR